MKINHILSAFALAFTAVGLGGCEGEKDLIIIDGNLPIKTTTLFMVGDATPAGWGIDQPTPLTPTEEDPLVFTWEGNLNTGEMKLCLAPGSWDAPFIRPLENGAEIGKTDLENVPFQMHAGDPDEKWRVTEAGNYRLTFNLRNWNMSTSYIGGAPIPEKEPIETETLYIVGSATPAGWNIDQPTMLEKIGDYIFVYEGPLMASDGGEMKACTTTGDWDAPFIRPENEGVTIGKEGISSSVFVMVANPDNKRVVTDSGNYRLTFNLKDYTIGCEFISEISGGEEPKEMPETDVLYLIGDATPGGWDLNSAEVFTQDPSDSRVFSWTGELVEGEFKACIIKDFSAPFLRPSSAGVTVSSEGASAPDFIYTENPDDKWNVTESGTYTIVFNLRDWTITANKL